MASAVSQCALTARMLVLAVARRLTMDPFQVFCRRPAVNSILFKGRRFHCVRRSSGVPRRFSEL